MKEKTIHIELKWIGADACADFPSGAWYAEERKGNVFTRWMSKLKRVVNKANEYQVMSDDYRTRNSVGVHMSEELKHKLVSYKFHTDAMGDLLDMESIMHMVGPPESMEEVECL